MKAFQDKGFNRDFPEAYNWEMLDSHKLREVAVELAKCTKFALDGCARHNVPGLRFALNIIGELADV